MKETLLEALALKDLARAGWVRVGVEGPESVASHSWGVAWLALVLLPPHLDLRRALTYAILHDLPEVRVGDLTPHDGVARADKAMAEHVAMAGLARDLPGGPGLLAAWEAYEAQADDEARFVRQLDRLDMALQAVRYARRGATGMRDFLESAARVVDDPALRPLLDELISSTTRS